VRGRRSAGDLTIEWTRRTRAGGDSWAVPDVPLSETVEAYEVEILDGVTVRRTLTASIPTVVYSSAQQIADFGAPPASVSLRVYQLNGSGSRGTPRIAIV
jgi:hypothetical protein